MAGKTCLVTGATSGIGFEAAKAFAGLGADVAMVGRHPARSPEALAAVRRAAAGGSVELHRTDLSVLEEVRALAGRIRERWSRLDVLVNNAGIMLADRRVTPDGFETTFATNHLGPFLLTLELLPLLERSAPARVVIVSSDAHRRATLAMDDLQGERDYAMIRNYAQSKTANVLFCYELARRLERRGSSVTVNAISPGVVRTRSLRDAGIVGVLLQLFYVLPFGRSPRAGADTVVWTATAPELERISGRYFVDRKAAPSSAETYDVAKAEALWQECVRLTRAPDLR